LKVSGRCGVGYSLPEWISGTIGAWCTLSFLWCGNGVPTPLYLALNPWKWFARLFNSHGDLPHWRTVIFKTSDGRM